MKNPRAACLALVFATFPGPALAGDEEGPGGPPPPASGGEDTPASGDGEGVEVEDPPDPDGAVERALARLRDEPSLAELQRAALRLADADPERARKWMRAANLAPLLPRLKATVDYDLERDESLDRDQEDPDQWGADTDRDLELQLSAQWELGELVFNPDEVRVYGALANRAQRRESLLATLVGHYFERRRLQVEEVLEPAADAAGAVERRLRIDELTAMIDALTGGLLSRTLESSPPRRAEQR